MRQSGPRRRRSRAVDYAADSPVRDFRPGFLVKLAFMAVVDALGVYVLLAAWDAASWGIFTAMAGLLAVANYVYFSKRAVWTKYLLPGLAFLLVYQLFVIGYTGYVAFTNYGDRHNSTKADAVTALLAQNERRIEGSPSYPLAVIEGDGELGFAIVDQQGEVRAGTAEEALQVVEDATVEDGRVVEVPGYRVLPRDQILQRQRAVTGLRVPVSQDPNDGSIRTQDARTGYAFAPTLVYDDRSDTMTDTVAGTVYRPNDQGLFEAPDGSTLPVGWRVVVGFDNFLDAFGDARYSGPFFKVLTWTFAFAIVSVATTFFLGLFFAMVLNDERVKGRKIYRTLLILPYAFPGFLSALLFAGLLNRRFGFVNQVLLGGAEIPWLTDPWLAKLSILAVNLWLGFPYMFLISTGALQSIPADVLEAATIDGAGRIRTWWSVTLPLLMVSTAPLLIASFAFNFNNFNLIYMLTGGGPRMSDASVPIGDTDILISMVYNISGLDGTAPKNYGLASALSIVIFLIVAGISAISFRKTRALEDIN